MTRPSLLTSNAVCTACGWSGPYSSAKHRSQNQLIARGVVNKNGLIIDSYLLNVQRRNGGHVDLTWCPICDVFIEVYYDKTEEIKG